jgi:hypothetical protein
LPIDRTSVRPGVIPEHWRKLRSWALTGTPPHATSLASNSDGREEAALKRALMKAPPAERPSANAEKRPHRRPKLAA